MRLSFHSGRAKTEERTLKGELPPMFPGGGAAGAKEGALLAPGQARGRQSKGTAPHRASPFPRPRRSAGRCRHPSSDSGAVLCCYGNSVGSWWVEEGQRLCPFAVAIKAFLRHPLSHLRRPWEALGPWGPPSLLQPVPVSMRNQASVWRDSSLGTLTQSASSNHTFLWRFPLHLLCRCGLFIRSANWGLWASCARRRLQSSE